MNKEPLTNPSGQQRFALTYREGLFHNVLPFWLKHGVDRELGGILCSLDRDGTVVDTDKGIWQQGRFTWLLGKLFNHVERNEEWLEIAKRNLDFLDEFGFDPVDGRMWFHVTKEGRPIRKRRYAFSESFAAIAYGEIAKATGERSIGGEGTKMFSIVSSTINLDPARRHTEIHEHPANSKGSVSR